MQRLSARFALLRYPGLRVSCIGQLLQQSLVGGDIFPTLVEAQATEEEVDASSLEDCQVGTSEHLANTLVGVQVVQLVAHALCQSLEWWAASIPWPPGFVCHDVFTVQVRKERPVYGAFVFGLKELGSRFVLIQRPSSTNLRYSIRGKHYASQ